MSREFIAVRQDMTVAEAIERLPAGEGTAHSAVIYVVDGQRCLLNVVPVRELLDVERALPMKLMPKAHVFSVTVDTEPETVARIARRYHLLVVPVLDRGGRLVGSITAHQVIHILRARQNRGRAAWRRAVQTRLSRLNDRWSQRVARWMTILRRPFRRP